jgi:hypothetical protein
MQPYKSKSGKDSGVAGYQAGKDYIIVEFKTGELYKYTYFSAGSKVIKTMKELALANRGLSSFISREQPSYESKL